MTDPVEIVGHDMAWWARVLDEMECHLEDRDLTFQLVWPHAQDLSLRGARTVVIGLATESWSLLGRAAGRVHATFQAGGPAPRPTGSVRAPLVPAITAMSLRARAGARNLPWRARRLIAQLSSSPDQPRPVFAVPLGCHSVSNRPADPIAQRPIEMSFAGSVTHWEGWWGSFTAKLGSPKVRSRRAMLGAVQRLQRVRPNTRVEIRETGHFMDFNPSAGMSTADAELASNEYWDLLMRTRISLVPSGAFEETFRHFEALRAGCVVVTDANLRGWYATGAPFIRVRSWDELGDAIRPLLDDEAELERYQRASLDWWTKRCSERVVGRFIASRLNELARGAAPGAVQATRARTP